MTNLANRSNKGEHTQPFGEPGQVFLRHVCIRLDHILHGHCSHGVDAGGHCARVNGVRERDVQNRIYCLVVINLHRLFMFPGKSNYIRLFVTANFVGQQV